MTYVLIMILLVLNIALFKRALYWRRRWEELAKAIVNHSKLPPS